MANYCVVQSGDSNSASTFGTITNTPGIHDSTSITLSASASYTKSFTAPSTTDDVLGVCVYFDQIGTGTVTAQLQEGGVDVSGVSVSLNLADLEEGRWIFFKLSTSYTFTSTATNHYQWKFTVASGVGTTTVASENSGGSQIAHRTVDDRTGVPASGDTVMNVGANGAPEYTLTMKGTQTIGNDTETYATLASDNDPDRRAIHDFYIADNGTVSLDRTAGGDLTIKGCFVPGRGATVDFGSEASPITKANAWTVQIDLNGTTSRYAIYCGNENTGISFQAIGEAIETHTTYVSGTGTLGDPMVVASSTFNLQVGDKIAIGGDDYTEFETRTVASVVSSTEYELSSALTYTHVAQTPVIQLTQGLEIKSTSSTEYWFFRHANNTVDGIKFKNVRVADVGGTLTYSRGIRTASAQGDVMSIDYCSFDNMYNYGLYTVASREDETFTFNVFYDLVGTQNAAAIVGSTGVTKEHQDCVFIGMERSAVLASGLYASVFRRCKMWNCGIDNNGNTGGGQLVSSGGLSFIDCEVEGSRTHAFVLQNVSNLLFQGCSLGSIADNPNAFTTTSGNYNSNILVQNCDFGAGTVFDDYDTQTTGSKLVVANKNGTAFANFTYRPEGVAQFCGTGLDDTTTTPLGNRSIRIAWNKCRIGL